MLSASAKQYRIAWNEIGACKWKVIGVGLSALRIADETDGLAASAHIPGLESVVDAEKLLGDFRNLRREERALQRNL